MNQFQSFVFETYSFDEASKKLSLNYSMDGELQFNEVYTFGFDFIDYDPVALDKAFQQLFFMAGVSYYKTYTPQNIVIKKGTLTDKEASFYSKTYQKGLGEFWYTNHLDPNRSVIFPTNSIKNSAVQTNGRGFLVAVGGGKDSILSIETLREAFDEEIATWSLNHEQQLRPLIETIGLPHCFVNRQLDPKLLNPAQLPGSTNGHIPISAIFACTGVIVAILTGKKDVVMSNERSADEATLSYQQVEINHQYSKTSEFEQDFQSQLNGCFGESIVYYSLLRPLCEVQIAKLFAEKYFGKYIGAFSSCNRAFVHGQTRLSWDGKCSKCAFVYLIFAPFMSEEKLVELFGHNLLFDSELEKTYRDLLGLTDEKPLECIGEIAESRWAMDQMKLKHPELNKYSYQSVRYQEIFKLSEHNLPPEISETILPDFAKI